MFMNLDWWSTCKYLFGVEIYDYQELLLKAILDDRHRKITVRATTRAGKSLTVAFAAILNAILRDGIRVGIIAPTYDKTRPIMDYIALYLSQNPAFEGIVMLDTSGLTRLERLRKEVSKQRITFRNGSLIEIKTIDIGRKGFALMGMGYDLIIVDESGEIPDEAYGKIYRMLLESEEAQIVEIGNPWHLNHFYEHHHAEDWFKQHIHWSDCVKEGRFNKESVEDQRKELSDLEFQVLLDAEFPQEVEFSVFQKDAINNLVQPKVLEKYEKYLIGVDVARGGTDKTVITEIGKQGQEFHFLHATPMDSRDVMQIAGMTGRIADKYGKNCEISVDTVGIGAGVFDRLNELKYNVFEFMAGRKARNEARFANLKSETIFKTADLAKQKQLWNVPPASKLVLELRSWIYEVRSDKQVKVIDPEKSPDEADSFIIALHKHVYEDEQVKAIGLDASLSERRKGLIIGGEKVRKRYL